MSRENQRRSGSGLVRSPPLAEVGLPDLTASRQAEIQSSSGGHSSLASAPAACSAAPSGLLGRRSGIALPIGELRASLARIGRAPPPPRLGLPSRSERYYLLWQSGRGCVALETDFQRLGPRQVLRCVHCGTYLGPPAGFFKPHRLACGGKRSPCVRSNCSSWSTSRVAPTVTIRPPSINAARSHISQTISRS